MRLKTLHELHNNKINSIHKPFYSQHSTESKQPPSVNILQKRTYRNDQEEKEDERNEACSNWLIQNLKKITDYGTSLVIIYQ